MRSKVETSNRLRRGLRTCGLRLTHAAAGAVALSLFVVVPLRWVPPPTTAFMLQHRLAVGRSGQPDRAPRQRWVPWGQISPELALAVIAAEDQRFLLHHGLDLDAIGDALDEREGGGRLRGASTISQQVAKNLYLWSGRSFLRKGLEAYLTIMLELTWSKRRILEIYLNVAEFGDGVYGVAEASERFFARPPSEVDAEQAALLAAVLPSPKRHDAAEPSAYLRERQAWILAHMNQLGGVAYLKGL